MKTWKDVGARWAAKVGAALGFTDDTPVIGLSEEVDYQGSCHVVVLAGPDEIVYYSWSYGSCSGCDGWEDREDMIGPEVRAGAKHMTIAEFKRFARPILLNPPHEYASWPSGRVACDEALAYLEGKQSCPAS